MKSSFALYFQLYTSKIIKYGGAYCQIPGKYVAFSYMYNHYLPIDCNFFSLHEKLG